MINLASISLLRGVNILSLVLSIKIFKILPIKLSITEQDITKLLAKINSLYPNANLKREDVYFHHVRGLVPIADKSATNGSLSPAKTIVFMTIKRLTDWRGLSLCLA